MDTEQAQITQLSIMLVIDKHIPTNCNEHNKFPIWYNLRTSKVIKEKKKYYKLWKNIFKYVRRTL